MEQDIEPQPVSCEVVQRRSEGSLVARFMFAIGIFLDRDRLFGVCIAAGERRGCSQLAPRLALSSGDKR